MADDDDTSLDPDEETEVPSEWMTTLSDMLSRGYYSVISPEGAAAIEAGTRQGQRVPPELIAECAKRLKITAADNLSMGYIDKVVEEPPLGARPHHYDFFKDLRQEVIRATDQVFLGIAGFKLFRAMPGSSSCRRSPAGASFSRP